MTDFGPNGEDVYLRTYSRTKPDGTKERWPETVSRVTEGNANLSPVLVGEDERAAVYDRMLDFSIIPAGRHLWASGVQGRQFLFNCWVAGWGESIADHFTFTFMRLMEGGGVGANYSSGNTMKYGPPERAVEVHIVCDHDHPDYLDLIESGLLSTVYSSDYQGAYMEVEDSREGWAEALRDLLEAAWSGSGSSVRVYDVSRVRAAGSRLKTFGGHASGPAPLARMLHGVAKVIQELHGPAEGYGAIEPVRLPMDPISAMEIDHEIAMCVVAGGVRRSARMSVLPWDDPYIDCFIRCKQDGTEHWTTNISIGLDDRFFDLHHKMDAQRIREMFRSAVEGMLANGEPGFVNLSKANTGETGYVECSNPCGEIFLEEWEACNLGHVNLESFVRIDGSFDLEGASEAVRLMTRFLVRATFGNISDARSREIMDRNRRIGVGLFGAQAAFAKMGIRYSEAPGNRMVQGILICLQSVARHEAREYAFELRIPEPVKVTTVAPTGTVAKMPGTSEGVHPIYSRYFLRRIRFSTVDPAQMAQLEEYRRKGYEIEDCVYAENTKVVTIPTKDRLVEDLESRGIDPTVLESADELSIGQMLDIQRLFQECWADNAVSFTANIPADTYKVEEMEDLLLKYLPDLKGTTIMPDGTREQAPYERISEADYLLYKLTEVSDSIDEDCVNACPVR
ncbi:ribonucleoside-triphosphate reductase, adenosylcobalamin-dependent [Actinomadura rubrisoli]|uniref:Adenosylcobalamin-dependent ribonucleoside-triphosphate reductase n=1 Tax=Actinomadura rubrisoli TaxID=2530368 RepID=A0A4R5CE18_9ACTN|nr:ribonucleoside-triphosphate reductase, adenosylcobalamin-dependent [Actinomadura rubrisoli]TDD97219.1 ribonucleoside-triphosphate reductase, adenosylcobalamin-dependent [Actinomadura rubrisoli]